jgi:CRP-like cAMP-binding protein
MRHADDPLAHLRSLPLFSGCSEQELSEIDALSDEVHVPSGRTLIRQGDIGREFIIILSGEVLVTRDGAEVARLGPGSYFGELALLASTVRNASVTAATDLEVSVIDRRGFQTLLEDSPGLTRTLLMSTARRLGELDAENRRLRGERPSEDNLAD